MPTKDVAKQTKCVIRKAKREKHFKKQERVNLVRQNIAEKLSQMKVAKKKKKMFRYAAERTLVILT